MHSPHALDGLRISLPGGGKVVVGAAGEPFSGDVEAGPDGLHGEVQPAGDFFDSLLEKIGRLGSGLARFGGFFGIGGGGPAPVLGGASAAAVAGPTLRGARTPAASFPGGAAALDGRLEIDVSIAQDRPPRVTRVESSDATLVPNIETGLTLLPQGT